MKKLLVLALLLGGCGGSGTVGVQEKEVAENAEKKTVVVLHVNRDAFAEFLGCEADRDSIRVYQDSALVVKTWPCTACTTAIDTSAIFIAYRRYVYVMRPQIGGEYSAITLFDSNCASIDVWAGGRPEWLK